MREELLKAVEKTDDLPPLPEILQRLKTMIDDPDSGVGDVAQVIQSDPVLSGRLLKLANNVYWRRGGLEVTGVNRALGRLGLKMALDLAYSSELPKLFKKNQVIQQTDFWRYSLGLAVAAQSIARRLGATRDEQSNAYLGGLMRNTGVLLFAHLEPEKYRTFLQDNILAAQSMDEAETAVFGISSAELGAAFIEKWWPVSSEVVDYVRQRCDVVEPTVQFSVCMGNAVLRAQGLSDGTGIETSTQSFDEFRGTFDFSEDDWNDLKEEIDTGISVLQDRSLN